MIRTIVTSLTMIGMMIHAVLGCCAHHDHGHQAVVTLPSSDEGTTAETHSCCCRHHHGPTGLSDRPNVPGGDDVVVSTPALPQDDSHHDQHDCSEHCSWVSETRSSMDVLMLPVVQRLPADSVAFLCADAAEENALRAVRSEDSAPSSATLRAELQVWRL
ncbi:MAG: hypothetical protein KDA81_02040 [Planctomycetaceae bacterium]|nr:hypothetical protein [Planctomycetaceae bacterium]